VTFIKLFGGDLDGEVAYYRCDFSRAAAPVQALGPDGDWVPTRYQCADCSHRVSGLSEIAKTLAAQACGMPAEKFNCWSSVCEEPKPAHR
jgi:hypothetical protein